MVGEDRTVSVEDTSLKMKTKTHLRKKRKAKMNVESEEGLERRGDVDSHSSCIVGSLVVFNC